MIKKEQGIEKCYITRLLLKIRNINLTFTDTKTVKLFMQTSGGIPNSFHRDMV